MMLGTVVFMLERQPVLGCQYVNTDCPEGPFDVVCTAVHDCWSVPKSSEERRQVKDTGHRSLVPHLAAGNTNSTAAAIIG